MKVYLVRHGQSLANTLGLFSGVTDSPLTDFGRQQARSVGHVLKDENFDAIYTSPLSRAFDTAALINGYHNLYLQKIEGLTEMNFGIFEGLSYEAIQLKYPILTEKWQMESSNFKFPQGESLTEFYERIVAVYKTIINQSKGDKILIVAHAGVIRSILANQISESFSHYWKYKVDNCKISILEYSDGVTMLNVHNK